MSFTGSSHSLAKNRTNMTQGSVIPAKAGIQLKKVMAFGTFDLFHPGHIYYLSEAEKLGESMLIVIARDARVEKLKKRKPHDDEEARLANVAHAFPHATVILGDESDIFAPLRTYEPHILVFGYDQRVPEDRIRELFPTTEIARIGSYEPERWKSSLIRAQKESVL